MASSRARRVGPLLMAALVAVGLAACATAGSPEQAAEQSCRTFGPKTIGGALIGAGSGAAVGAVAGGGKGAAIGAGLGLVVGLIAGNVADKHDCRIALAALRAAAEQASLQPVRWQNPQTGSYGAFQPVTASVETAPDGRVCRRLNVMASYHGGPPATQPALTCRTPDGDWVPG